MVRKSPFSDLQKNTIKSSPSKNNDIFNTEWLILPGDTLAGTSEVDLTTLYYFKCDRNNERIEERILYVRNIAKAVQNKQKDGRAISSYSSGYYSFVVYIKFCDSNGLQPFSKEGYLAYVGDDGELRRKIALNNEMPLYLFDLKDGVELGITESSAQDREYDVRMYLRMAGCYIESWKDEYDPFLLEDRKLTIPYSSEDTNNALSILIPVFEKLYEYLENGYTTNSKFDPTVATIVQLDDALGSLHFDGTGINHPFNICMSCGYALFSYYTALNKGVILRAAHPIQFEKRLLKEKSVKYICLSLWKTRSGKFVEAYLTDDTSLVDVDDNEFDINIEKRTGVSLVEKLVRLGEMFGDASKGSPLFFHLDNNKFYVDFRIALLAKLAQILDVRINDVTPTAHIFHMGFNFAIDDYFFNVKRVSMDDGNIFLSKKISKVSSCKAHREAISCAIGLLVSYNNPETIYGALLPLVYDYDHDGNVIATFHRVDGSVGSIIMPIEYNRFLNRLEEWASKKCESGYLLPFPQSTGKKAFRWLDKKRIPSIHTTVRLLGIPHGAFYLDLTAKRFRALTAKLEYNDEDFGANASVVLDNTIGTFDAAYANGDPEQNQLITYQALEILSRLFKGETKDEAIKMVKESLKIDVLEFDEYKKSKTLHINQNGTACDGKCDLNKDIASDTHRASAKQAKELGVGNGDITCFQFDLCCFCKSAKLVNDVNQVYKTLSFIQILEDRADLRPDDEDKLLQKALYFKLLVHLNIDDDVLAKAEEKLILEGLHPLTKSMQIALIMI